MKILITGSQGFIGKHLCSGLTEALIERWDIKAGTPGDIFDDVFEQAVKRTDVVYHLAALTSVDKSFKNPDEVFITNVMGMARVAYLCAKYKKKLIYPSSGAIYHPEFSPYAYTKYLAEEIVKGIMKTIPVVILRLFNVFGPGMNPNTGSIMCQFLTKDKITVHGDGEQTRDFIHVKDVVFIMKDALKKKWDGKIVDIGTGQSYTINYIAGLFAHYRKKKIEYIPPIREIKWSIANTQMLKSLYKKKLTTSIKDDIETLCNQ